MGLGTGLVSAGIPLGAVIKDNSGNVFLDAGGHLITSDNWSILGDGSASFVSDDVILGGSTAGNQINGATTLQQDTTINGNLSVYGALGHFDNVLEAGSFQILDGLATIDANGNIDTDGSASFGLQILGGSLQISGGNASIYSDGSASFAGGGTTIDASGNIDTDGSASFASGGTTIDANGNIVTTLGVAAQNYYLYNPIDTLTASASYWTNNFVLGVDGKPYFSDGSAFHALY